MIKVSPQDQHILAAHHWHIDARGYVRRHVVDDGNQKCILLHRVVVNAPAGMVVDHINGDKLDNRRENLRVCSLAENALNKPMHKRNKIGFKGVYKDRNRFRAEINIGMKRFRLGTFDTPEMAHEAYKAAATKLHGEFARFK